MAKDIIILGGPNAIPPDVVVRRYWKGLSNMRQLYLPLANLAAIYDNNDASRTLIAERRPDEVLTIHDTVRWTMIEKATS
jgi:predicted ABC-type ATPase